MEGDQGVLTDRDVSRGRNCGLCRLVGSGRPCVELWWPHKQELLTLQPLVLSGAIRAPKADGPPKATEPGNHLLKGKHTTLNNLIIARNLALPKMVISCDMEGDDWLQPDHSGIHTVLMQCHQMGKENTTYFYLYLFKLHLISLTLKILKVSGRVSQQLCFK